MANGSFKKRNESKSSCDQSFKKTKKNIYNHPEEKENFFYPNNIGRATEYLYSNPTFMMQSINRKYRSRLEAGDEQNEIFYDCTASDGEVKQGGSGILQQQLQILEIINEMKNPKRFKGLLKQLAYTTNALFRTFRHAYNQTKKNRQNMMRGVKRPIDTTNMAVQSSNSQIDIPYVHFETLKTATDTQNKPPSHRENNYFKEAENNICQEEDELQHLSFCERCSVLRGEMPWPTKNTKEQPYVSEKLQETSNQPEAPTKHVLNLRPVSITIPLKLQVDGQNSQPHIIETEIVMEAFGTGQSGTLIESAENHSYIVQKPAVISTSAHESDNSQGQSDSDIFYSCISSSDIMNSFESQTTGVEKTLNKILEILKQHLPTITESPTTLPPALETKVQAKAIPMTSSATFLKTSSSLPKLFSGGPSFTQTTHIIAPKVEPQALELAPPPLPPPPPTPPSPLSSPQPDAESKANQLRAELLKQIGGALEQTTTLEALKNVKDGKRFSLPQETTKETSAGHNATARHSAPMAYSTTPTSTAALQSFSTMPISTLSGLRTDDTLRKPQLPPKPTTIPPIPTSRPVQTDASTLKFSGHFKRSEMRNNIQDDLAELLEQTPRSQAKFKTEDRDAILLDLHRLFHPKRAGTLPEQISRENALQDIRYLLEPDAQEVQEAQTTETAGIPKATESEESILKSVKYILNPKVAQKSKKKKYTKDAKERILENLQFLLTRRQQRAERSREVRDSVLHDLHYMLNADQEVTSGQKTSNMEFISSRSQLARQLTAQKPSGIEPISSRSQLARQLSLQIPSDTTNKGLTEPRYSLDSAKPKTVPKNKSQTNVSSRESSNDSN